MGLKNFQYNKILREYDRRQLENRHQLEKKHEKVYAHIPQLKEISQSIASNSIRYGKAAILGQNPPLDELRQLNKALSHKKRLLLKEYGYPEDYLTPDYQCRDCCDTGYIGTEKCHCFKQAIVDLLYSQSNIRQIVAYENFHTFSYDYYPNDRIEPTTGLTPYENIKKVVASCLAFIKTFDAEYNNLLFYGNTGVGKTFLTNCIAKELLDTAHTVIYLTSFQLFDILEKNKFSKSEEDYEVKEQFQGILECDLLIIDDLGTELNNSFISSQLYLCINERHLNHRSTIISTNLSLDDLNSQYSERIFSRITSNYSLLKIIGDDIRLKKAFS